MAAIPVFFSMAEPAWPLNIPDSLDINQGNSLPSSLSVRLYLTLSYHGGERNKDVIK